VSLDPPKSAYCLRHLEIGHSHWVDWPPPLSIGMERQRFGVEKQTVGSQVHYRSPQGTIGRLSVPRNMLCFQTIRGIGAAIPMGQLLFLASRDVS
jgi:hypothetical protein